MTDDPRLITTTAFTVASWDVDATGRLTTTAMGRYLQEAAEANAHGLDAGYAELRAEGQTWVLSGLLLEVRRYPGFTDTVTVETWPRDIARRRALRDFRLRDAAGETFAMAASSWFCLDLASRRPVSPERWRRIAWAESERATDRDPARQPALEGDPDDEVAVAVPVRWSDLDLNGHVTNTRYQDLLLEAYPASWLTGHAVASIELEFLAECRYPETLQSRRQADPAAGGAWRHALTRASDDKDVCRARVAWR